MARINIEDSLWSDSRFIKLCIKLSDARIAVGAMVLAWKEAQKHWCPDKKPIPRPVWDEVGIGEEVIQVGLARERPDGIYMCGTEKHFAWWFDKRQQTKEAGLASAAARKAKYGTSQPLMPPEFEESASPNGHERTSNAPERASNGRSGLVRGSPERTSNDSERAFERSRTETNDTEPSYSYSSSYSSLEEENLKPPLLRNGKGQVAKKADGTASPTRSVPHENTTGYLVKTYVDAWRKKYGTTARPEITGATTGLLAKLAPHYPKGQLALMLQVYCQMDEPYFRQRAHDLFTFKRCLNQISLAMDKGRDNPTEKTWRDIVDESEKKNLGVKRDRPTLRLANEATVEPMEE